MKGRVPKENRGSKKISSLKKSLRDRQVNSRENHCGTQRFKTGRASHQDFCLFWVLGVGALVESPPLLLVGETFWSFLPLAGFLPLETTGFCSYCWVLLCCWPL